MSILGTDVAAGVAGVSLQAQQVGRQRVREQVEATGDLRRHQDLVETTVEALEETDEESPANLRVDSESGHASPQQQRDEQKKHAASPNAARSAASESPTPDSPLYRHVDVQA